MIDALHKLNLQGQEAIDEIEALLQGRMGITDKLAIAMVIGPREWHDPDGRPMISMGSVPQETGAVMMKSAIERLAMQALQKKLDGDGSG